MAAHHATWCVVEATVCSVFQKAIMFTFGATLRRNTPEQAKSLADPQRFLYQRVQEKKIYLKKLLRWFAGVLQRFAQKY